MIDQLYKHLPNIDPELIVEFYEERAAVRQYEANYPQDEAERLAFQDTIDYFSLANHILNTSTI